MAVAGRELLRWLGQPHILQMTQFQFEALLKSVAEYAEEWLTSAQAMGLADRRPAVRVLPQSRGAPAPTRRPSAASRSVGERSFEFEFEV
jgi:hypothetical protein